MLCATTEFGTLEPFYCPENARQVVCGLPMDDGLTLCVYLDPLNKACADLVNAAGEQVDHVDLGIEGGKGDFSVTVLPRTTDRDAVLKVDYGSTLVALRVQDGKFIRRAAHSWAQARRTGSSSGPVTVRVKWSAKGGSRRRRRRRISSS